MLTKRPAGRLRAAVDRGGDGRQLELGAEAERAGVGEAVVGWGPVVEAGQRLVADDLRLVQRDHRLEHGPERAVGDHVGQVVAPPCRGGVDVADHGAPVGVMHDQGRRHAREALSLLDGVDDHRLDPGRLEHVGDEPPVAGIAVDDHHGGADRWSSHGFLRPAARPDS